LAFLVPTDPGIFILPLRRYTPAPLLSGNLTPDASACKTLPMLSKENYITSQIILAF